MSWGSIIVIGSVSAAYFGWKLVGRVSAKAAKKFLRAGALVVDVRSAGEFQAGHLAGAINIPLDELHHRLPHHVPDKNRVLLLHCLSGARSGIARRALKSIGYANVFNLGSLARARKIAVGVRDA